MSFEIPLSLTRADLSRAAAALRRPRPSVVALLAGNAVPVVGVLALGWTVFPLLLLYWLENLIVGAFNVLRMLAAQPGSLRQWAAKLFIVPFFCVHYGVFTAVHGIFVFVLFSRPVEGMTMGPGLVQALVVREGIGFAALALIASHGVSFAWNYLYRGEFRRVTPEQLMGRPYGRVVVLHIVILAGGFLSAAFGSPVVALLILVVLKTAIDVVAHVREHANPHHTA